MFFSDSVTFSEWETASWTACTKIVSVTNWLMHFADKVACPSNAWLHEPCKPNIAPLFSLMFWGLQRCKATCLIVLMPHFPPPQKPQTEARQILIHTSVDVQRNRKILQCLRRKSRKWRHDRHTTRRASLKKKRGEKSTCRESFEQMPSSFFFQDRKIKNPNIVFHTANLCLSVAFRVLVVYLFISESPDTPVTFQHFHGSCHFLVSLDVVLASVLGFVMAVMFKCVYALWRRRGWRW